MIAALALAAGLSPQAADVTGLWNAPGDGGSLFGWRGKPGDEPACVQICVDAV